MMPANISHNQVEEITDIIISKTNFSPEESIEELIVNKFKGKIEYLPYEQIFNSKSGSVEVIGNKNFVIRVNENDNLMRRRFTIAHELGHYVLHSNFGKEPLNADRSDVSDRAEWEANWFAAGLLMPKQKFIEKYNNNPDIFNLAGFFKVSTDAIKARISYLKRINEIQ